MSQSSLTDLKNLRLVLYGYHVRNTIDEGVKPIWEAAQIWENLSKIPGLENLKKYLLCYQNELYTPEQEDKHATEYIELNHQDINFSLSDTVTGSLYPYRLHDTYAFDLTLRAASFEALQKLKKPLFDFLKPSLGSTWIFYAELPFPALHPDELAQRLVRELFPNYSSPRIIRQDSLESCSFIRKEVGKPSPIFVSFIPTDINLSSQTDQLLLNLFWYYHKILYANREARKLDLSGRNYYAQIERYVNNFAQEISVKDRLKIFQDRLLEIPQLSINYATTLRNLKDQQITAIANLENLKKTVQKLQSLPHTQLDYFETFIQRSETYIKQIETDLNFLYPGESLLQRLTDNIRGIVAIDQVEQHEISQEKAQRLEQLIAYLGIGLGVSSISSSVISEGGRNLIKDWLRGQICDPSLAHSSYDLCLGFLAILFHIIVGLVAGLITYLILKLLENNKLRNK
jgi:hypothetical protein